MAFPAPPEGALTTPRFAFRQSMIPRPATKKEDDSLSPKSVITDRRFISPASSSSSSIDRRTSSETNHLKCQPRHDRGYSISDGEFSDPDSFTDSTGTSRELGKVGNSGPLESLPETHSLALEATNLNASAAVEMSKPLSASKHLGDGEPTCRFPFATSLNGLESSEPTALSVFAERTSDSGRGEHDSSPHSSAALRSNKTYQDQATSVPTPRSNSDGRGLQTPASQAAAVDDGDRIHQISEWSQTSTSSESATEQDGKESSSSSTRRSYTESEGGTRLRDLHSSRPRTFSSELSTSGNLLDRGDDSKRKVVGPGAANNFGYVPGTPVRFFPGWQGHPGTPPVNNNASSAYSASPRVSEKGVGSYSPASSADLPMGLRYQHRFFSGPIMGSMIPKPPPSKWDDAEKWIVSPGHNETSPAQPTHRPVQTLPTGRRHSIANAQNLRSYYEAGSPDYSTPAGEKPMSPQFEKAFVNAGKIEGGPTFTIAQKKRSKALSFGDISRRFDPSCVVADKPPAEPQDRAFTEGDGRMAKASVPSMESRELNEGSLSAREDRQQAQPPVDKSEIVSDSTMTTFFDDSKDSRISKHARSVSMKEISTVPASYQERTSCRDMGTQMTPMESLKNSTCTTPGLATSPTRHNTPTTRSGPRRAASLGAIPGAVDSLELQSCHLAKLELRKLAGDGQPTLDRTIVWTTREEEERESAASLREDPEELERFQMAAKATAWEEAAQKKSLLRYQKEEAKIKAYEELQKAQAESEMKKTEAKVEKILAEAKEKMEGKLTLAAKKAAEMRAAAEVVRNEQAAKTKERAGMILKTGRLTPRTRSSFRSCFRA